MMLTLGSWSSISFQAQGTGTSRGGRRDELRYSFGPRSVLAAPRENGAKSLGAKGEGAKGEGAAGRSRCAPRRRRGGQAQLRHVSSALLHEPVEFLVQLPAHQPQLLNATQLLVRGVKDRAQVQPPGRGGAHDSAAPRRVRLAGVRKQQGAMDLRAIGRLVVTRNIDR